MNVEYIFKMAKAGMTPAQIAKRMGCTEETVKEVLKTTTDALKNSGFVALAEVWYHACVRYESMAEQHRMLGEMLKQISLWLDSPLPAQSLKDAITSDPEQTLKNLSENFLILRPFRVAKIENAIATPPPPIPWIDPSKN